MHTVHTHTHVNLGEIRSRRGTVGWRCVPCAVSTLNGPRFLLISRNTSVCLFLTILFRHYLHRRDSAPRNVCVCQRAAEFKPSTLQHHHSQTYRNIYNMNEHKNLSGRNDNVKKKKGCKNLFFYQRLQTL